MSLDDLSTFYHANQALAAGLGVLAGVGLLLAMANRLRKMREHRATLLIANILTIIAAALATTVSASGMWKFFTDILGHTPLRIAFFAFLEIALFASALLERSRLLREPHNSTTGVDGIAVWVLAGLTASLSALDSDSAREVCLRLVAPLVAAWMWERALAAERRVRLGTASSRRHWTISPQRILVWLRLAEPFDRDVSEVDQARRRASLARTRLRLHLLQSRKTAAWRVRRAHRKVIKQAMKAAEHLGLADFPSATTEREAVQMYMATLYGFVEATSPQAVAHLNAWRSTQAGQVSGTNKAYMAATAGTRRSTAPVTDDGDAAAGAGGQAEPTAAPSSSATFTRSAEPARHNIPIGSLTAGMAARGSRMASTTVAHGATTSLDNRPPTTIAKATRADITPSITSVDQRGYGENSGKQVNKANTHAENLPRHYADGHEAAEEPTRRPADTTAIITMRRYWETQLAAGRIPSGADLSRAAGVLPSTGLGRRKRREWIAEVSGPLQA